MKALQRAVLLVGVGCTVVGLLALFLAPLGRGTPSEWFGSAASILQFLLIAAAVTFWTLAPFWGVFRQQSPPPDGRGEQLIVLAATVLVAVLAAGVYLPTFIFHGGHRRMTGSAMALLYVPVYQWLVVASATGLQELLHRYSARRQ